MTTVKVTRAVVAQALRDVAAREEPVLHLTASQRRRIAKITDRNRRRFPAAY